MLLDNMQHVNMRHIGLAPPSDLVEDSHHSPSTAYPDRGSQTSAGSPISQTTATKSSADQLSQSTLPTTSTRELTPPSSVSSGQGYGIAGEAQEQNGNHIAGNKPVPLQGPPMRYGSQSSPESHLTGRKRTANGVIKQPNVAIDTRLAQSSGKGHYRNTSTASDASTTNVAELSAQLRTRLTYAMVKVQNGWQNRSLDEVESLASQSPTSVAGFSSTADGRNFWSPISTISARLHRSGSDSSSGTDTVIRHQPNCPTTSTTSNGHMATSAPQSLRKTLAPPANIVPAPRRKHTSNGHLRLNSLSKSGNASARPVGSQRTPSQNAAMEADAVETLLFMASPNNSGHFPNFSPTANNQRHSLQTSPLRSHFNARYSPISPKRVAFSSDAALSVRPSQDNSSLIENLIDSLDDDSNEDLDEAIRLMERHRAAKQLST